MPYFSTLSETAQSREDLSAFGGYNHNLRISDGEFYETKNLTNDFYPVMSQRHKRAVKTTLTAPQGIIAKDALAYIDGGVLFYNGADMSSYMTDIQITTGQKQLVSMGAYLCIFPDGIYFNTENYDDNGYMAHTNTINAATTNITYAICKLNGDIISYTASATEPASPANGTYWLDTSRDEHVLKVYSGTSASWVAVGTCYIKITANGIGQGLSDYDGVTISGCTGSNQVSDLNTTTVVYDRGDNFIVVVGLLDSSVTQTSGTVTVSRSVPDMDFVTECGNRLWGCKYGVVGGKTVNEIYCCALGDFKNWRRYMGISTDSWTASVGSDGQFTGAVTHLGYPLFFKENCIHKVYPSAVGAHQIVTTNCRGVQKDSSKSLAIVNEILFYKSMIDICSFDGSMPSTVSTALGNEHYTNAVAGSCGDKYYISMKDSENHYQFFVLDTGKGLWLHEDGAQATDFAEKDNDLFFINADGDLISEHGTDGTEESSVEWEAETGIIGFEYPDKKYVSRFNVRMCLGAGASMDLSIMYDSSDEWEHMGHIEGTDLRTFTLPIKPRRCDHLRIKLEGIGEFKLYSIAKILEVGSDY